jgi:hypothetical protein
VLGLDGELDMLCDCDVEGGGDKEGWGRGAYILDTIRLGRQEMSHVGSCIRIRTWTIVYAGGNPPPTLRRKDFPAEQLQEDGKGVCGVGKVLCSGLCRGCEGMTQIERFYN